MSADETVPAAEALRGLTIHPVPDGWTPMAAIVLVKCLDDEGQTTWAFRTTDGLNEEELLGALTVRTDLLREALVDMYTADD